MTIDTHIKNWKSEEVREQLRYFAVEQFTEEVMDYAREISYTLKETQRLIYEWYKNEVLR